MTRTEQAVHNSNLNTTARLIRASIKDQQEQKYAIHYMLWRINEPGCGGEPTAMFYGLDPIRTDAIRARVQSLSMSDAEFAEECAREREVEGRLS